MKASQDNSLLVVTSFSDRPETELYCRLAATGMGISMMCHPNAPELDKLHAAGVRVIPMDTENTHRVDSVHAIQDCIRLNSIGTVYAPRTFSLSIAATALKDSDVLLVGYRGTTGHLSLFDFTPRKAYKNPRVNRIVCVSNAVKEYLHTTGIPEATLVTIPKGHDPNWYAPAERTRLAEFGIPDDAFVVGFAGSVRPVKGVSYLIQALDEAPMDIPIHILICGELKDSSVRRLLSRSSYRDRVHTAGFQNDASSLMGACDAFAMPSLKREGLPRALVEAMAQGVPCIASRAGGIPELIVDGDSGLLVTPADASAIAASIARLARNSGEARLIGINARKRIESHFHIDTTVARMRDVFTA